MKVSSPSSSSLGAPAGFVFTASIETMADPSRGSKATIPPDNRTHEFVGMEAPFHQGCRLSRLLEGHSLPQPRGCVPPRRDAMRYSQSISC